MNNREEVKYIYRLPPCPAYDIESTESWLESMAERGWFLAKDGFFFGFALFEQREPKTVRYRLEASPHPISIWSDREEPADEALSITEALGWKYVTGRGNFYIFVSEDPAARELNTDPQVQAIALDMVRKRERGSFFAAVLWLLYDLFFLMRGTIFLPAVTLGTWHYLLGVLIVTWALASSVVRVVHLRRLRNRMRRGEELDHKKDWKRWGKWHRLEPFLFILLVLVWAGVLLHGWGADITEENEMDLTAYTEPLPFGTIGELLPGGTLKWQNHGYGNTIEIRSDILAPEIISFCQLASVTAKDGTRIEGGLYIDYFETVSPWLAQTLAREYETYEKLKDWEDYEKIEAPDVDADYVSAYNTRHAPTLILADGNRMIRIFFYQTSDQRMPMEEWAKIFTKEFCDRG